MAGERGAKIGGNVLLSRLEFARARLGAEAFEKMLASFAPEEQALLRGRVLEAALYPLELNHRLDDAIAQRISPKDPQRIYLELGRASAEKNLHGAHQTFLQPGDPQRFLANAKYVYKFYYAAGYRTYEKTGPHSGVLRTFDADNVTIADCLTVVGWYQRALELCGAKDVTITEPLCRAKGAPHCEYHVKWSGPAA